MMAFDRRSLLTTMLGACVAAGAVGAAATSAMAVPRAAPPKPAGATDTAEAAMEGAETAEGNLHNAQFVVIRRRPRRRWRIFRRPIRRRRRFY